jgi:Uma2 family endonuclease
MSTLPESFLTPEQYLEIERHAEFKSEYYNGEMFAMSGASRWHGRISFRLNSLLEQHLEDKPCEGYASEMRVLTPGGLYTYPDLVVTCEEPRFQDKQVDTLLNPTLIVEILSPSAENYDLGRKADLYREIPSLREILFIDQDRYAVQLQRRQPDDTWSLSKVEGLENSVELASIGYTLALKSLYAIVLRHRARASNQP